MSCLKFDYQLTRMFPGEISRKVNNMVTISRPVMYLKLLKTREQEALRTSVHLHRKG